MNGSKEIQSKMIMRSGREVNYDSRLGKAKKDHQNDLDEENVEFQDAEIGSRAGSKASSRNGSRPNGTSIRSTSSGKSKSSVRSNMERFQAEAQAKMVQLEAEERMRKVQDQERDLEIERKAEALRREKRDIEMHLRKEKLKMDIDGAMSDYHKALREEECDAASEGSEIQEIRNEDYELILPKTLNAKMDDLAGKKSSRNDALSVRRKLSIQEPDMYSSDRKESDDNVTKFANAITAVIETAIGNAKEQKRSSMVRQTMGDRDLPVFWGEPETWINFYRQLVKSTELFGYTDEENVLRLQKCLRGKAKEAVESLLVTSCSLDEIISTLEKRFGRPQQIMKTLVQKAKNVPAPSESNMESLMDFAIAVRNLCATAESLEFEEYLCNPQILEEFIGKLPASLKLDWGRHARLKTNGRPRLIDLSRYLSDLAEEASFVGDSDTFSGRKDDRDHRNNDRRKAHGRDHEHQRKQQFAMVVKEEKCVLNCSHKHELKSCRKFKAMELHERWEIVKKNGLCFSCLQNGHQTKHCNQLNECKINDCRRHHNELLHFEKRTDWNAKKAEPQPSNFDHFAGTVRKPIDDVLPAGETWMRVLPVVLRNGGIEVKVNAFLDDGSELTLIDEELAKELKLEGEADALNLGWIDGANAKDASSQKVKLEIANAGDRKRWYKMKNVHTKSDLVLPLQGLQQYKFWRKWKHLRNVPATPALGSRPKILIGQDNINLTIPREIREGKWNEPVASLTKLGWVVHGRSGNNRRGLSFMCAAFQDSKDEELHQLVKEHFRLDSLGMKVVENLPRSKDDARAEEMMEQLSYREDDGRIIVPMLWKENVLPLPESRGAAMRRLMIIEKQMDKDPALDDLYCGKINEYVEKGFCRKLSNEEARVQNDRTWFLPHFGTRNPNKPAKLRLVFDCAAKTNGMGLNDALLQGPDLMIPLLTVLTKFRQREIAFAGDIRDMFHMVKIRQEDLPSLRFLWRGKTRGPNVQFDVYTMNVMVFGAVSSPFQAQWAKNKNAEDFREEFPDAVEAIQKKHYVDDYLDSSTTVGDAVKLITDVKEVHRRGGFEIRGWISNSVDVVKAVTHEEAVSNENFELVPEDKLERVLGVYWDPKTDDFKFKKRFRNVPADVLEGSRMPTKRELLSLVACLFDPLGFVAHLTIKAKILLQDIWRDGIGWDEKLPTKFGDKWKSLLDQLDQIEIVKIPRCYAPKISDADELQLHIFCDASSQAYCAVAYLRATWRGGESEKYNCNLIMAKSRVSPVRLSSIPRLELNAALIGSRLVSQIKEDLELKIDKTFMWTDSMTTLCWIKSDDPRKFKVYVACRVGEILDRTEACLWRHVPTKENPADEATRDVVGANLEPGSVWFKGPTFLEKSEDMWPKEKLKTQDVNISDLEMKKESCCLTILMLVDVFEVSKYSSWWRVIRVTAWVKRFVNNLVAIVRNKAKIAGSLRVAEIEQAERFWMRKVQIESYSREYGELVEGKALYKESRLLSLCPVMKNGLMCVKSRLEFALDLEDSTKFPVILDSKHPYTVLLMTEYHIRGGHTGLELACNEIRQRYWIPGMRNALKKVWKMCNHCNLEKAKELSPVMAPLPEVRVSRGMRAFTHVGVDYFGPIEVKILRRSVKRYGVLFTCLKTRAVHLEVAHSLSTDSMIMALERFVSRRGEPIEIWSDNGTNFKGAEVELKKCLQEMNQEIIENKMTRRGIQWNFIPPSAPHMGGAWERLVRSVKVALGATLRDEKLSDEVLLTVMAEAEASVNSRPLTHVSVDKDDEEALTPNCFLMGTTSVKQPPGEFKMDGSCLRKQWRIAQVKADRFWSRWISEYLPSLSLRSKWTKEVPEMKIGDLVFVVDTNMPRNNWLKGRIEKVFPGRDGHVRVVDVKTAHGLYRRPVTKLCRIVLSDTPRSCHLEGYVGDALQVSR